MHGLISCRRFGRARSLRSNRADERSYATSSSEPKNVCHQWRRSRYSPSSSTSPPRLQTHHDHRQPPRLKALSHISLPEIHALIIAGSSPPS
ncbi:hypothetical protein F2Q70_00039564 [Brassica cretica]|uniref:Uncharacterized protein n=2 Tax=Brassica cretica TaxID=69181 RepID=A0A8S9K6G8_BRACR|nr:hypothetical protein F2Q70_00039564 [Brassica cretica]KAF2620211.1 hypothetical protein F2Q68_00040287 [Brassica cretica]KAF3495798.1 hypothetical protein DY000_02054117 [Brassica cretica]